jgi:hypothetical protein
MQVNNYSSSKSWCDSLGAKIESRLLSDDILVIRMSGELQSPSFPILSTPVNSLGSIFRLVAKCIAIAKGRLYLLSKL